MSSIVTITLNPALDKSIIVPELVPEKKLRALASKVEPGGGGINVSRALHKLGVASEAVFLSGGYTGKMLETLLHKEEVSFVALPVSADTRENFVVFDEQKKLQYRFGMPGEAVNEQELQGILDHISSKTDIAYLVVSGSLPPGMPVTILSRLAVIAHTIKAKLVVDTSGDALKAAVKEGVYLIKPNLGELCALVGKDWLEKSQVADAARTVIAAGSCEAMVVSMGAEGAMLVTATECYEACAPKVQVLSTVGAGDSMVAGMLAALHKRLGWEEVLQYGVSAGSAATLHPGTELCSLEDTERIFKELKHI
jgi:6-phosphofructokinase 2